MTHANTHSMEDIVAYLGKTTDEKHCDATTAVLYFLYKEILVNRVHIFEADPAKNRGAIEHYERLINELNEKLMAHMDK